RSLHPLLPNLIPLAVRAERLVIPGHDFLPLNVCSKDPRLGDSQRSIVLALYPPPGAGAIAGPQSTAPAAPGTRGRRRASGLSRTSVSACTVTARLHVERGIGVKKVPL